MRRPVACLMTVVAVVAASGAAAGQERTGRARRAAIVWLAPRGCPSQDEFERRVADAGAEASDAAIRVTAAARADGTWQVTIENEEAGAESRVLFGTSCDEVASAAALVVAMLGGRPEPDAAPAPVADPDPGQVEDAELPPGGVSQRPLHVVRAVQPRPRSAGAPRLVAAGGVGAEIGLLPGLAPVAMFAIGAAGRRLAAEVEIAYSTIGHESTMGDGQIVDARYRALTAGVVVCLRPGRFSLCGGPEIGRVTAEAASSIDRDSGSGSWLAARVGPGLLLPVAPGVELVLEAELAIPLLYPDFSVNGQMLPGPSRAAVRSAGGVRVAF